MDLSFGIKNLSENVALDVVVSKIQVLNSDGTEFWTNEREHRYANIGMDGVTINLKNPDFTSHDQIMLFRLSFKDKFGNYHTLLAEGRQIGKELSFPRFSVKEI